MANVKVKAHVEGAIWTKGKGSQNKISATLKFNARKPKCSNCNNPNKRMCVAFAVKGGYGYYDKVVLSLCTDCLHELVGGVNDMVKQYRMLRTIINGTGAGSAIPSVETDGIVGDELDKDIDRVLGK